MKYLSTLALMFGGHLLAGQGGWERQVLLSEFYAEGCGVGDLNGDGVVDLSYGPFWFAGPDFKRGL
ncbi:hypothetical protein N9017_02595, partial [Akkermansiaceae bacterium]|nr:hypothetical protein [Akkermansiaceae bacterium]